MNPATTAETITVGQLGVRFLVEGSDSNGSVSVFECYVPANSKMPAPHSHDAFEETIYGLEGVTTWTIDGETTEIGVGEAVCVPRGAIHGFENRGRARLLPGGRRGPGCLRGWSAGPRRPGGGDAPAWPHAGTARWGLVSIYTRGLLLRLEPRFALGSAFDHERAAHAALRR
jgi:quercetin dioxygenase-like cupin family protein